jgi:putative transposase
MKYKPNEHRRRSIRLQGYDYSQAGAYFVTICTQNQECLLGEIISGEMRLNDAGRMVQTIWQKLPHRFPSVKLDQFIVMPNHVHGIVMLATRRGEPCVRPFPDEQDVQSEYRIQGEHNTQGEHKVRPYGTLPGTIGRIAQAFKSSTTHEYAMGVKQNGWPRFPGKLWQRNYYEHVIRDEDELNGIRQYIACNPANWAEDRENPSSAKYRDDDEPYFS